MVVGIPEVAADDQEGLGKDGRKLVSESEGTEESLSARSPREQTRGGDSPNLKPTWDSNLKTLQADLSISLGAQSAPVPFLVSPRKARVGKIHNCPMITANNLS